MFSTPAFKSALPSSCVCLPALFILPSLFSMTAYSSVRKCLSVCLSTCNLSDCLCCHSLQPILSVCLSVCVALAVWSCLSLSLHLSANSSVCICHSTCLYLPVCLSCVCLPVLSASLYIHLPVPLSVCLPVRCRSVNRAACLRLVARLSMRST